AAGVECLDPAEFVRHGDKGFQVKPFVPRPKRMSRKQLDRLQDCVIKIHDAGYAVHDDVQAGVDETGRPVMFDVGKASPIERTEAEYGFRSDVSGDMERLRRLYEDWGHVFVRRDVDEGEQAWTRAKAAVKRALADPTRHAVARRALARATETRRQI